MEDLILTPLLILLAVAIPTVIWLTERRRRMSPRPSASRDRAEEDRRFAPEFWRGQGRG